MAPTRRSRATRASSTISKASIFAYGCSIFSRISLARLRPRALVMSPGDERAWPWPRLPRPTAFRSGIPGPNFSNNAFQWRVNRFFLAGKTCRSVYSRKMSAALACRAATLLRPRSADSERTEYARRAMGTPARQSRRFCSPMLRNPETSGRRCRQAKKAASTAGIGYGESGGADHFRRGGSGGGS